MGLYDHTYKEVNEIKPMISSIQYCTLGFNLMYYVLKLLYGLTWLSLIELNDYHIFTGHFSFPVIQYIS